MRDCVNDRSCGHVRAIARQEFFARWRPRLAAVVGLGLIVCGTFKGYTLWRQGHLQQQAENFARHGDYANAVLVTRHLLQIDGRNAAAVRLMANLADRCGSREAVTWRKMVLALDPGQPGDRFALASSAFRCGDVQLARNSLARLPEKLRGGFQYHQLAGAIALACRQLDEAEKNFAAAHLQNPENDDATLNLATVQLQSASAQNAAGARAALAQMILRPAARTAALRLLITDALAHRETAAADGWSAALLAQPDVVFADRLLRLEATRTQANADEARRDCEAHAARSAGSAAELITWMNRHDLAETALTFSRGLPAAIQETQPMPLAIAEALSCSRKWDELARFVADKHWQAFEPLRLTIESHALEHSEHDKTASAKSETLWRAALRSAFGNPEMLAAIARLEEGWGYKAHAEEAWWTMANGNANAREALTSLQHFYAATHDTRGLLRVAKRALELNPADFVAANNCASLGLLLHSDNSSRRLAAKLYREHPAEAALAATYAFALHTDGKTGEGLKVIGSLADTQLHVPAVAAYYVIMLVANGETERALSFLPAARTATLLPEEQQLLAVATQKLLRENSVEAVATS